MQSLEAPVELDFKETNKKWEGKWLNENAKINDEKMA